MASSEALSLVELGPGDAAGGLALSSGAGWNQTADDWALFIDQGQALGFRTASGRLVATAASLVYGGGYGWIAMVLVAPEWRHRGLASLLTDGCIKRLRAAHVVPVLDATPGGEPVYRHLGFRSNFGFERWEGEVAGRAGAEPEPGVRTGGPADLDAIVALDQGAHGVGRRALLQNLLGRAGTRAWMAIDGSGFVLTRDGHRATQVGPLVAAGESEASALFKSAVRSVAGPVFFDVPQRWDRLAACLERASFVRQRPFTRMSLGGPATLAAGDTLFVVAGPEFG